MKEIRLTFFLFILPYFIFMFFYMYFYLIGVKKTKRVMDKNPYFSYPWYKRMFLLGLCKHKYLTVTAFFFNIFHFLSFVFHILILFIDNKTLVRITGFLLGFSIISFQLMNTYKLINKDGWKLNK